jgi:hypothetical protein
MFQTNNLSSSGGMYKQLTVFFYAFYEESVRCHDIIDTQQLDYSLNAMKNTISCLYRLPDDEQLFVRNVSRINSLK